MGIVTGCALERDAINAVFNRRLDQSERVTETYRITLDDFTRDSIAILSGALTAGPDPLPNRGEPWPANPFYGLFSDVYTIGHWNNQLKILTCKVDYTPLQPSEPSNQGGNPLTWDTTYDVAFMENEYVVDSAYNLDDFTGPYSRPAGTLGPVCNSVGDETDDPLRDVDRVAVLKIMRNIATIQEIMAINANYQKTTNSSEFLGIPVRSAKFMGCESLGRQVWEGFEYYPTVTSVGVYKTTDRFLNNVGWNFFNFLGDKARYVVKDPVTNQDTPTSTAGYLTLAGTRSLTAHVQIGYRYLTPVNYSGLI